MSFLDKYELGELISEGEARTSKARELSSGREVMVHELPTGADRTRGADLLRMIHRYLRSIPPKARNPILELGEHEGRMYLVTEAIPGLSSLRTWLEAGLTTGVPAPEAAEASRLREAPAAATSFSADVVQAGPVPADATATRTQVIKVAPREWVLAGPAEPSTPQPVGTSATDVTMVAPVPPVPSSAGFPAQQAAPVAAVESPGRFSGPEPWRAGSDDATAVGLAPVDRSSAPSDVTVLAPAASLQGSSADLPSRPAAPEPGPPEATKVFPSPGGSDFDASGAWLKESGTAVKNNPPPPRSVLEGEVPNPPAPSSAPGGFTMVLGGPQKAGDWEPPKPPAPPPPSPAGGSQAGEFTRFIQAAPAAAASPSGVAQAPQSGQSGDFTRMFGGVCAPSRPGERGPDAGSNVLGSPPAADPFAGVTPAPFATGPANVPSELPGALGQPAAGEFTKIFGAPGAPGPLSFGPDPPAGGYTSKPAPGEFTQIFGRQGAVPARDPSPAHFELPSSPGVPDLLSAGGPLPSSAPQPGAPSGAAKGVALPDIKTPAVPAPPKSVKTPSAPVAPKIPSPPPLPKMPIPPPAKPAVPAAPKLPPPPKIPVPPAAPALKAKAVPAAAKLPKPRRSSLPLVLILGGLLLVATALVLYFALAGH